MIEKITSSQQAMDLEAKYGAHNYHPLPVVLAKGKGANFGLFRCQPRPLPPENHQGYDRPG